MGQGCFRHDQHKLLPAVTTDDVFLAHRRTEQFSNLAEDFIARLMTMLIVEALEVIDIDHDGTQRPLISHGSTKLPLQRLLHIAAIEEAG